MDTELGQNLRDALSGQYTLERELLGAGMSRVFVANDNALGRKIVIKVLPPEMAASVRIERFRREIHKREGITAFRDAAKLGEGVSLYLVSLVYGLAAGGEHDEAREMLASLRERAETEFVWPMGMGMAYAHLGETNTAMDFLERAYDERVGWMLMIGRDPALDTLRELPRFQTLARKIGPGPQ